MTYDDFNIAIYMINLKDDIPRENDRYINFNEYTLSIVNYYDINFPTTIKFKKNKVTLFYISTYRDYISLLDSELDKENIIEILSYDIYSDDGLFQLQTLYKSNDIFSIFIMNEIVNEGSDYYMPLKEFFNVH